MTLPGFNAEASLGPSRSSYRGKYLYGGFASAQAGLPAGLLSDQLEGVEELADEEGAEAAEELEAEDTEGLEEEVSNGELS